jgi:hypothetical protein
MWRNRPTVIGSSAARKYAEAYSFALPLASLSSSPFRSFSLYLYSFISWTVCNMFTGNGIKIFTGELQQPPSPTSINPPLLTGERACRGL